ncbi:hypothetical protein CRU99_13825 [Malaciobacter mytili]|uniref:hypothetical protein n=1 Tax=Malaciobacter mytili TaxID=603050 RepID=UPI00100C0C92|nr:hypothetical protein [Malaciobacter mytili]RXI35552.1 hypothetical protein CRU99_13825 [Malaciobacter mytili]
MILAKISGYRDYQFTKDSVLNLDSDIYQKQALNELKILYMIIKNEKARDKIVDVLVKDIQEIEGGYEEIAQYTMQDENHIFIVPNSDGSKVTYATFTDGFNEKGAYEINSEGSINVNFEDRVIIANKFYEIKKVA